MILPDWLQPLAPREELERKFHGLTPKSDGWYKSVDGKTRYICKPCTVAEVTKILPAKVQSIRDRSIGREIRTVRMTPGVSLLKEVADAYQAWLWQRLETGVPKKLARRTYDDSIDAVLDFVSIAGPQKPADAVGDAEFSAYAKELSGLAASSRRRKIIYVEAFANWAAPGSRKAGLITRPWRFGPDFVKPGADEMCLSAADSDKAYTPKQLRQAFLAVKNHPALRAAGWLCLCGAFGPKDCGTLPENIFDLDTGYIRFPRGKTGTGRICWIPPAGVLAVKKYLESRPDKCDESAQGLLFRSSNGLPYYREPEGNESGPRYDSIGNQWSKKTGLPISGLRSTFATTVDDWMDQRAVDVVMGHRTGKTGRQVRGKSYAKKVNPERVKRLVSAFVPLAFGRKSPEWTRLGGQAAES